MINDWIKCDEFLPKENGPYLTCCGNFYQVIEFCDGHWNCHKIRGKLNLEHEIKSVLAWQPIDEYAR